jgi:predicted amidohydrolase YtcJ
MKSISRNRFLLQFLLLQLCLINCTSLLVAQEYADLILTNGQVYTVNKNQPFAEAIAIRDDKIIFVGTNAEAGKYRGTNSELVDCKGQFIMPGFVDGHGHIHSLGESLTILNLANAKNWNEIINIVAEKIKKSKPGDWIIGRGWHQEKWSPSPSKNYLGYPYHEELDKISSDNPVLLTHASGHSCYVNAKAMQLAGITMQTPNPRGGDIVKDKSGKIVGVLEETAQNLVYGPYEAWVNKRPAQARKDEWVRSISMAEQLCLSKGVTSFQDAGTSMQQVQWMKELALQGKLQIRHWMMVRGGYHVISQNESSLQLINEGNNFLTVKAIKVTLDGALGSYGAWLLEPYSDRKDFFGQNTYPIEELKKIAEFAWTKNLQLCVHAIGDKANRETINIFAEQIQKDKKKDHRWRVEHAQHVNPAEIPRFKEWNIIASMQGVHCTSDAPFVVNRLGEKRAEEGAYVWKSFLNAGVLVNNGTDVPVEDVDPLACFYSTVTRKTKDGSTFYPKQSMTREEAIYSYTMANAIAAFEEKQKGSLEPGKLADIVILSNNLVNCKDEEIQKTRVMMTIVGGKVKYKQ